MPRSYFISTSMYTKDSLMPFGKYRTWRLADVPVEYLLRLYISGPLPDRALFSYIENLLGSLGMWKKTRQILLEGIGSKTVKIRCEKVMYRSVRAAGEALHNIQKRSFANKIPRRCYRCNVCGFWHLTSLHNWNTPNGEHRKAWK